MASSTIASDETKARTERDSALSLNSTPESTSLYGNFPAILAFVVVGGVFLLAIITIIARVFLKSSKRKKYFSSAEKEFGEMEGRPSSKGDSILAPVTNERASNSSRASTARYASQSETQGSHKSFIFPPPPARLPPAATVSTYKHIESSPFYGPVPSPTLHGLNGNDQSDIPTLSLNGSYIGTRYRNTCTCSPRCWLDEPDRFSTLINFNAQFPTNPVAMPVNLPLDTCWEAFPHNLQGELLFSEYRILHVFQTSDQGFKCLAESDKTSSSRNGSKYCELQFMKSRCEFERMCAMLKCAAGEPVQGDGFNQEDRARIVQLHSVYLANFGHEEYYVAVTPHYVTNLTAYLQRNPPTSPHTKKLLLEDLTRCLYSLHRKRIAHGNIQSSAFVKDLESGDGFGGWKLVLDVNAAKFVSDGDVGTILMGSVALEFQSATCEADVWAFGCIAFEIYTGKKYVPAHAGIARTSSNTQQELRGIQTVDPGAYDILIQMLDPDQNSRISLHSVIECASKRISKFLTCAENASLSNASYGGDNESVLGWWDAAVDLPYWDPNEVGRLYEEQLEDHANTKQRAKRYALGDGSTRMATFGVEENEGLKMDETQSLRYSYLDLDAYTNIDYSISETAKVDVYEEYHTPEARKPTPNNRNGSLRPDTSSQHLAVPNPAKSSSKFSMPSQITNASSRAAATTATNLIIDAAAHGLDPRAVMAAVSQRDRVRQNGNGRDGQANVLARERLQEIREQLMNARDHKLSRYYAVLPSAECQALGKQMKQPRTWDAQTFRLHILCEGLGPAHIHHEVHFTRHTGYKISNPQSFIQWTAPALSLTMKSLAAAIIASGSAQSIDLPDGFDNWLEIDGRSVRPTRWFEWMARVLSGYAVGAGNGNSKNELKGNLVEAMIEIEAFLYRNSHEDCGSLRPVMMADGEIRWLCRQHVEMCSAAAEAMTRVGSDERNVNRPNTACL